MAGLAVVIEEVECNRGGDEAFTGYKAGEW